MKVPRFEAQADRWGDDARFVFIFSQEAHPRAQGQRALLEDLDKLLASDKDGDGRVTREEYGGSELIFGSCDLDEDGAVVSHEATAIRRIGEFSDVVEPTDDAMRRRLAQRLRDEVPGDVPILLDAPDNRTSKAYHGWPNAGFVLDAKCRIAAKEQWAGQAWIEQTLSRLTGRAAVEIAPPPLDWSAVATELAAAKAASTPLLLRFSAPGCDACARQEVALKTPEARAALATLRVVHLDIARDEHWALFESLGLHATPAFALVAPSGPEVLRSTEGFVPAPRLAEFVRPRAQP